MMFIMPLTRNHFMISTSPEGEVRVLRFGLGYLSLGRGQICVANLGEGTDARGERS